MTSCFELLRAIAYVDKKYPNADDEFKSRKVRKCVEIFEGDDYES